MLDSQKLLLYSVNILLSSINELAISSDVEFAEIIEAQKAVDTIEEVKKAVLATEWDFNTDEEWEFAPNLEGYINIPANVLDISSQDADIVVRNWRLYSKSKQSAIFTEPVKCKVVWDMDFNTLSHPLRHFITIRASRIYQYRMIGDVQHYQFSEDDEHQAYISARRSDGRTAKYNMLSGTFGREVNVRGN